MCNYIKIAFFLATLLALTFGENIQSQSTITQQTTGVSPTSPSHHDNVAQYVGGVAPYSPPTAYQYAEPNYGPVQGYDPYMPYSASTTSLQSQDEGYQSGFSSYLATIPYATIIYKFLTKVGAVLLGGSALLIVGGLLTTAVCSVTPFCTIEFNGFGINRESMRSFMTADNLNTATTLVQEAIDKYQKFNRKH